MSNAQNSTNILVEYEFDNGYFKNLETLVANTNDAIKITGKLNLKKNEESKSDVEGNYILNQKDIFIGKKSIFLNKKNDFAYIIMPYSKNKDYFVKDNIGALNWNLVAGETKKIGNYKCNKATLNFRGRDYVVYYTSELPIPFGPWKFKNLPGLILYAKSVTGDLKFTWTIKDIKYPYKDFKEPLNWTKKETITLKEYVALKDANRKKRMEISKSRSEQGVNVTTKITRMGLELIYEWEEERDKK